MDDQSITGASAEGFRFRFDFEGNVVLATGSPYSGMERVYLNGALFSQQRSFRRNSEHRFNHQSKEFCVQFDISSKKKGMLECTLIADDVLIKRYRLTPAKRQFGLNYVLSLIVIAGFSVLLSVYNYSFWYFLPMGIVLAYFYSCDNLDRSTIEEIEIPG
ncbi:MAG: hypothetical protein GY703_18130 [Gammaproteobacteria bacterium]|nr:hypothetical protein [Gammaproteobacteria bacterium]